MSEVLSKIGKAYIPGVIDFYAAMNPDPWQAAHDKFEKALSLHDEQITEIAGQALLETCITLIERFKKEGKPSKGVTPADAFMMGLGENSNPKDGEEHKRLEQWERIKRSLRYRECYRCYTKENLVPVTHPEEPTVTFLACRACKTKYRLK